MRGRRRILTMNNGIVHREKEENQSEDWDSWDPMNEDYVSIKNTLALNPDKDPLSTITGKECPTNLKIGNVPICERYAKYGECADGNYCTKKHVCPKLRSKIWACQNTINESRGREIMKYTDLSPIEIQPDSKSMMLATVPSIKSPSNFHVVLTFSHNVSQCNREELEFYINRIHTTSDAKVKLHTIHRQLKLLFDHNYRIDNLNDDIYLSQIVACKTEKGLFCRAMVIDIPREVEDFHYKLFLLDVGTEISLLRELIYDIKAHCLSEPPLAMNCRLNIKPAEVQTTWSEEALKYFTSLTSAPHVLCTVTDFMSLDDIFVVDLVDINTRQSITDLMVEKAYAVRCVG